MPYASCATGSCSLQSASVAAQQGIERGFAELAEAASDVAYAFAGDSVSISPEARAPGGGERPRRDEVSALVSLGRARHTIVANLESFRTIDELTREALRIGRR